MTRRRAPILLLLLCLLLGLGFTGWLLRNEPAPPPLEPAPEAPPVVTAASPQIGAAMAPTPPAAAPDNAAVASERLPAAAPAAPSNAVITGRCVDERGLPLAAGMVKLHVHQKNAATKPAPLEQQPAGDGRFEFTVEPRPGQTFWLYATAEGRVGQQAYWPGLTSGERIDCGSFRLVPGVVVRGRVADTNHVPVANASVEVAHGPPGAPGSPGPGRTLSFWARTGADGAFATAGALPAGEFTVRVHGDQQPAQPHTGVLTLERPVEFVTIVVPVLDPSEWITGTVVDQRGNPLPGASVDTGDYTSRVMTRRDGGFRMRRSAGADPGRPVQLHVASDDHAYQPVGPAVAWGSTRIELLAPDGNSLELQVRDPDGRPVEDFEVTLDSDRTRPPTRSPASKHRPGPFPGGTAVLKGVVLGPMSLLIEFGSSAPHPPRLLTIDLVAQHSRIEVQAEAIVTRTLEVIDASGQPVAGVPVVLCDPVDGEFSPVTPVVTGRRILMPHIKQAMQLQTTTTDGSGRAQLRGPGARELAVRLPGPGHEPTQCAGVSLAVPEPLRIEVRVGAHLVGKLGPLDAVEFLRSLAGDAAAQQRNPLQLQFQRPVIDRSVPPLPAVPLAADGSFEQRGLLPGTYLVSLQHAQPGFELLGEVTLVDGRTTRFDAEIPVALMIPGTLAGRMLKNGHPAAGVQVTLLGTCAAVNGSTRTETAAAKTDADGRFRVQLRPGSYRATVQLGSAAIVRNSLQAAETALVQSRTTTEQDFTLATGTLQVTLRSATGTAMPEVTIFNTPVDAMPTVMLPATDKAGSTTIELLAGTIALRTLPKHLQSAKARNHLFMESGWGAFDAYGIPLGTAEVRVGATATVELRLPADWDR